MIKGTRDMSKCIICKEKYTGYGNNAMPVANGKCCDRCNATVVIPARIARIITKKEWKTL